MDLRDLGQSFLKTEGKGTDCTDSWQGCIKQGQLSTSMVVVERELSTPGTTNEVHRTA